jgi:hypothetical protein
VRRRALRFAERSRPQRSHFAQQRHSFRFVHLREQGFERVHAFSRAAQIPKQTLALAQGFAVVRRIAKQSPAPDRATGEARSFEHARALEVQCAPAERIG